MIKRVVTDCKYDHDEWVEDAIEKLQDKGFEVLEVRKIKSIKFVMFGNNVTEIKYKKV